MLQLTKRTEYGLIALTHLAKRGGVITSAREISEHYPVPKRLLAEVMKCLTHAHLIESHRGAHGGYTLARPASSITIGDVVGALEGELTLTTCESLEAGRSGLCEVEPVCPIRSPIHRLRAGIWDLFQRTTLSDIARPRALQSVR